MSGQAIGSILGTVAGSFFGPVGAAIGGAIGGAIGSSFDTLPTQYGPRLDDLRPQTSEYGKPIPIVYGTVGMGGNVIWASDYVEVETETEQGGKGGPSQTTVTYSYFGNFAILLAEGPATVGRLWAGPSKRLIYDGVLLEGGGTVRIYNGTEDQLPDPLIESYEGVGNVPAFRGACYAVFENFPLENDGNAIPFITAEVGATASGNGLPPVELADAVPTTGATIATIDPLTGWVWNVSDEFNTHSFSLRVISDVEKTVVGDFTIDTTPYFSSTSVRGMTVAPSEGMVYVLLEPWVLDSRLAAVASFTMGAINPDGTIAAAPTFVGIESYGDPLSQTPRDAQAIGANGSQVWIAYAFTNTSQTHVAVYDNPSSYTEIFPGEVIGMPFQILGDDQYMAVAGRSGPVGVNFQIYDAVGLTLLHSLYLPVASSGKAYDYDPKRQVFIGYVQNSADWIVIDAATGEVTTHTLEIINPDITPTPTLLTTAITYSSRNDKYLLGADGDGTGTGTTIYVVNPDSGVTESTFTFEDGGDMTSPLLDPITKKGAPYVLSFGNGSVKRLYVGGSFAAAPLGLGAIVADLSARAGLAADQVDVSQLTDMVDGYAIARQTTVRAAIDALRPAYYFDAVESGGKVKYVKRGGQAVAVIEDDDLDAHQADGQPGDPLLTTRQMEVELPKTVNVNYLSAATDYEKATQIYKRQVGSSEEEATLDLPLVLSDTKGQEIAQVNAHLPWVQRLRYGPFNLPRKYSHLEPTDIITIRGYEMMLEKVTASPGGILTCEAVATDSSHYTPHVVVTETMPTEKVVYVPGETTLELM